MKEILQTLLEDRQQREEQFAEERRLQEHELRRQEEEQRENSYAEMKKQQGRRREMQEQMNVLKSLVNEIHEQGEGHSGNRQLKIRMSGCKTDGCR